MVKYMFDLFSSSIIFLQNILRPRVAPSKGDTGTLASPPILSYVAAVDHCRTRLQAYNKK
jgi:hypothetical protein